MNTSKLDNGIEAAIVQFHHVSGAIFFMINASVCLLIVCDRDPRGYLYRKYLISLQLSSTALDCLCNVYAPILLVNCLTIYSNSLLAKHLDLVFFGTLEIFLFGTVANSYLACVFYRRRVVLPAGGGFWLAGPRRILLLLALQLIVTIDCVAIYLAVCDGRAKTVPAVLGWLSHTESYLLVSETLSLFITAAGSVAYYFVLLFVAAAMICQVLVELKHGMHHSSTATKRYQKRAVVSLILQGLIPSLMYAIPAVVISTLYIKIRLDDLETAAMDRMTATASALALSVLTTHTAAHSLTIVACSPSYRKKIRQCARHPLRALFSASTAQRRRPTQFLYTVTKAFDK